MPTPWPRICPTASNAAWKSPGRWARTPRPLLLDEPAAGLNPSESRELMEMIQRIAKTGVNVLLVEHDMSVVMNVSHRVVVLDHGVCICQGTPAEVRSNPEVIEAYLGSETDQ